MSILICRRCGSGDLTLVNQGEEANEICEGTLRCQRCRETYPIHRGIPDFLDPADKGISNEVEGWIALAGPLGDGLQTTMTALPYYPHAPWIHVGPDFFQIFEHVNFSGLRVLDLGAGRTWSSRHLATIGRAAQVIATDVLTERYLGLETAEIFFREDANFFERIRADMHHLPLKTGTIDAVVSVASLHHSSDLPSLFREIHRLLKIGGRLVFVSEPSKKVSIESSQPQNAETEHGINEHIYSLEEYVRPLRSLGFRCKRLAPRSIRFRLTYGDEEFLAGFPRVLRRLFRSRIGPAAAEFLLKRKWPGAILYRYCNLPVSLVARKTH